MDPHSIVDWREIFSDVLKFILGAIWVSGRKFCRDLNHAFKMLRNHEDRLAALEKPVTVEVHTPSESSSHHEGGH